MKLLHFTDFRIVSNSQTGYEVQVSSSYPVTHFHSVSDYLPGVTGYDGIVENPDQVYAGPLCEAFTSREHC